MIESALGNYSICSERFDKAKAVGISPYGENVGTQFLSLAATQGQREGLQEI